VSPRRAVTECHDAARRGSYVALRDPAQHNAWVDVTVGNPPHVGEKHSSSAPQGRAPGSPARLGRPMTQDEFEVSADVDGRRISVERTTREWTNVRDADP
jgi:hypothetical protein